MPEAISPSPLSTMFLSGFYAAPLRPEPDRGDAPHIHTMGQLYCLSAGMVMIETETGLDAVLPRQLGWIPPGIAHSSHEHGGTQGWAAYLAPKRCGLLPKRAGTLCCSELLLLLMERLLTLVSAGKTIAPFYPDSPCKRLALVFLDELASAVPSARHLPYPRDSRLVRITREIARDPGSQRSIAEWGAWAGISERGISRHFMDETGLTFAQWRRAVRLMKAQELLASDTSVQEAAWTLGYENVSSFIAAFKDMFGQTPAQYRFMMGRQ